MRLALRGLEVVPRLGPRGASNGTAATLYVTLLLLGCTEHLKALERCPRPCRAYDEALRFKRLGIQKHESASNNSAGKGEESPSRQVSPGSGRLEVAAEEEWPEDEEF